MDNFGGIFDGVNSFTLTKYGSEHWYQWGSVLNIAGLVVAPNAWWGIYLPKSPNTVTFQTGARHYTWGSPNFGTLDMTAEDDVRIHNEWEVGFIGTARYGGTMTLNGNIIFRSNRPDMTAKVDSTVGGVGSIQKDNDHTLLLTGTNTYTGNTTINDGVVRIVHVDSPLGTSIGNQTYVNSGGSLEVDYDQVGIYLTEALTLNGFGHNNQGALFSNTAHPGPDMNNIITLGSDASISCASRIDHINLMTDNGGGYTLFKKGAGELVRGGLANFKCLAIDEGAYTVTTDDALPGGAGTSVTNNSVLTLWAQLDINNSPNLILNDGSLYSVASGASRSYINGTAVINGDINMQSWRVRHTNDMAISGSGVLTFASIVDTPDDASYTFSGNNTYTGTNRVGNGGAGGGKMTLVQPQHLV